MKRNMTLDEIRLKAAVLRRHVLEMDYQTEGGHIGGALQSADILCTLFFGVMNHSPEQTEKKILARDRFVLSKGHISDAYYAVLAMSDYFPINELESYVACGSRLGGHPTNKVPGIEMNIGALGHGFSVAVGMAKAAKLDNSESQIYLLLGDGEMEEGSNWEAIMAAAHFGLDNLTAIVDRNMLQIGGSTESVMALGDLSAKFKAFGWDAYEVDGHDIAAMKTLFTSENISGKPPFWTSGCIILISASTFMTPSRHVTALLSLS